MDGTLYLAARKPTSRFCLWVIGAVHFRYISLFILNKAFAFDKISMHQTYFIAWKQSEIFSGRLLHKIFPLNIQFPAEWNLPCPQLLIFQIIGCIQIFYLIFWIIINHQFNRI